MNQIVARYDADAADYARYWGPVLEGTARRLLDYVEPFVAGRGGRVRVLEVGTGTGALLLAALERWPMAEFVATEPARGMLDLAESRVHEARPDESRVIFLEGGRVTATGTHEELLATSPGYAAIIHAYELEER